MIKQEFCGGVIPQCPVCERGVQPQHIDEHVREIGGVFYHGACARFAAFVERSDAPSVITPWIISVREDLRTIANMSGVHGNILGEAINYARHALASFPATTTSDAEAALRVKEGVFLFTLPGDIF